jgi:microcystin-dependent protein
MALLPPLFNAQFFTDTGEVAAGYLLDTFESGTTTPKDSFTDQAGATENENPIELDAAGRCNLWLGTGEYRFRLRTPDGLTTVWTRDDVAGVPAAEDGAFVPLAGGTMTGLLTLSGNAQSALNAVPKQQLDAAIAALSATIATSLASAGAPIGSISLWLTGTAPTNWLHLNGQAVSRTTYAALFALWGTTFGVGNGSTTFNVPEVRGEFPRFWDASRGIDSGRGIGTAQAADIAAHTHSLSTLGNAEADSQSGESSGLVSPSIAAAGAITNLTAPSTGTETRPRNFSFMAIVRAL